ncbi:zinc finger protein 557-like [Battus philenor]|uniref:zinc finger protein 557-like n=1 Tax=Battus philenor TaxID=42288 RepID=UPI0035CED41F
MDADNTGIMVQSLPLLGICNLCLHQGVVKSMLIKTEHSGDAESYLEMLSKCFSIDVLKTNLEDTKRVICFACINELEHCISFKEKVEASLKSLEDMVKMPRPTKDTVVVIKQEIQDPGQEVTWSTDDATVFKEEVQDPVHDVTEQSAVNVKEELTIEHTPTQCENKSDDNHVGTTVDAVFEVKPVEVPVQKVTANDAVINEQDSDEYHPKKSRKKTPSSAKRDANSVKKNADTTVKERRNILPFKLEKDQLDCAICKKKFPNFVNLNSHMNIHYPNHNCKDCGKSFASPGRLRGHMRTHEVGDFPCRYCDAVFDKAKKRENHVSKEHKSGLRYSCKRCNIPLSSFYARQKHLAEVHNEELKRYKCNECPQSYITPGHLSSHVRRDHLNERNHKCDKCDLAFYTKNSLKAHMIKHDGERIHTCDICQKSYQRLNTLREHMRIHNNDKRFVCTVCGRAFIQKKTLISHLKVHERRYECEEQPAQPPVDAIATTTDTVTNSGSSLLFFYS